MGMPGCQCRRSLFADLGGFGGCFRYSFGSKSLQLVLSSGRFRYSSRTCYWLAVLFATQNAAHFQCKEDWSRFLNRSRRNFGRFLSLGKSCCKGLARFSYWWKKEKHFQKRRFQQLLLRHSHQSKRECSLGRIRVQGTLYPNMTIMKMEHN